jgi:hypothetical protein
MGFQSNYSSDQLQPCSNRALSIVLMRLRVAEIDEDAIAHILRDEAPAVTYCLRHALLIGLMTSRRSSGSMRADSAVEPTRSENITVT